jgi:hypothetical protein
MDDPGAEDTPNDSPRRSEARAEKEPVAELAPPLSAADPAGETRRRLAAVETYWLATVQPALSTGAPPRRPFAHFTPVFGVQYAHGRYVSGTHGRNYGRLL